MNRGGYIKFWRKIQDSLSWNRGLLYQGLIINLLSRAAWKNGSYLGRDILPGQFGTVMSRLAESLGVPKTTLHRMVSHLEEDGFLRVSNAGNRFTVITIINWDIYQDSPDDQWNAGGTQVEHQRNAGGKPSYKEEEDKKIRNKNINTPPHPPEGGGEDISNPAHAPVEKEKKARKKTGNSLPELAAAIAAYAPDPGLQSALENFRGMRERIRKPMTGLALQLLFRKLDEMAKGDTALKIALLEQSILNSWQSLYPLRENARASPNGSGSRPVKSFQELQAETVWAEWEAGQRQSEKAKEYSRE